MFPKPQIHITTPVNHRVADALEELRVLASLHQRVLDNLDLQTLPVDRRQGVANQLLIMRDRAETSRVKTLTPQ